MPSQIFLKIHSYSPFHANPVQWKHVAQMFNRVETRAAEEGTNQIVKHNAEQPLLFTALVLVLFVDIIKDT